MTLAEKRALARKSWPSERTTLAQQDEAFGPFDVSAGWHAVLELTWQTFSMAGRMPPSIPRAQWPSRLFQAGERRPDSNGV